MATAASKKIAEYAKLTSRIADLEHELLSEDVRKFYPPQPDAKWLKWCREYGTKPAEPEEPEEPEEVKPKSGKKKAAA